MKGKQVLLSYKVLKKIILYTLSPELAEFTMV